MKFIVDQEIDLLKEKDEFETARYSETLAEIIQSSPDSSFSIGLFGEWGTGKSSIIKTTENILSSEIKKYHFITYDAWKYSKDSFRRTFLLKLIKELKISPSEKFESFYKSTIKTLDIKSGVDRPFVVVFIVISILLLMSAYNLDKKTAGDMTYHSLMLLALIGVNFSVNFFKKHVTTSQEPMIFAPEQFEECFESILHEVLISKPVLSKVGDWIIRKSDVRTLDKLVIVVDNIDRCDAESAFELLSIIKTFLGYDNIVFIIPVDDTALRKHVAETTKTDLREADEFLRKLFNNTLKIKPYKKTDLYSYAENISKDYSLELLPDTIDVVSKEYASNPRRIIQFLNSLISEKAYLTKRKGEEFVNEYETLIAIGQIIREEWPVLYKDISNAPFKLKNIDLIIENDQYEKDKNLYIFLKASNPHTINADEEVLKVIFGNQDAHGNVSEDVIRSVKLEESAELQSYLENSDDGLKDIVQYFITELEHATKRNVKSSLVEAFNALLFINNVQEINSSLNRSISGVLHEYNDFMGCLDGANEKLLPVYLDTLNKQNSNDLLVALLECLNKLHGDDDSIVKSEPALYAKHWSVLIKNLAVHIQDEIYLEDLSNPLYYVFRDEGFDISDLGISDKFVSIVTKGKFADLVISRNDYEDDVRIKELLYLAKYKSYNKEQVTTVINDFYNKHVNYISFPGEKVIKNIKVLSGVLSFSMCNINNEVIDNIVNNMFAKRNLSSPEKTLNNISVYEEIVEKPENVEVVISFMRWVYVRSSKSHATVAKWIPHISTTCSKGLELIAIMLSDLHKVNGYKLVPFHDYLTANINKDVVDKFFSWLLLEKDKDDEYILSDERAKTVLEKCIDNFVLEVNDESYFHDWLKDNRVRDILKDILIEYEKEKIVKLPTTVIEPFFENICEGDNISEYSENAEVLSAMSELNKPEYNSEIEKVLLEKLNKEGTFRDGIELLNQLSGFSGMQKPVIKSMIKKGAKNFEDDEELVENIACALTKIKSSR